MKLSFRPLKPGLMDCMGEVLRGSWGASCWCMYPRLGSKEAQALGGQRRKQAMTAIARRKRAPGLLAFEGDEPVGWIAIAPRTEYRRIEASRVTPRVDDVDVWVIPCVTVAPGARGRGIALALIRAAVAYAAKRGAPAVEAYPRAGAARTKDDNAYFGTEPLFRRAGFRAIRKPVNGLRVTMRVTCAGDRARRAARRRAG